MDVWCAGPWFATGWSVSRSFTPFRSNQEKGLGVCMAICESVVKAHGWFITVTKSDATGARMTVTLPLAGQE